MKYTSKIMAVVLALALAAALGLAAFAEPADASGPAGGIEYRDEFGNLVTPTGPGDYSLADGLEPIAPRDDLLAAPEPTTLPQTTLRPIVTTTAPETTEEAVDDALDGEAAAAQSFAEYVRENMLQLIAIAMSGLALLFSVIALARSKGKGRRRKRNPYF